MTRPMPPAELLEEYPTRFAPSYELLEWLTATFIHEGGKLHNEDHAHLVAARLGCLWTNAPASRHGRTIVAQCEFKPPTGSMGKWQKARAELQLDQWFGEPLDFLLTLDARYAQDCTDAQFCALVEHELYHAGQAINDGQPVFTRSGTPVFAMRAHDVEEFIGVVRRYGVVSDDVRKLLEAANEHPEITDQMLRGICGTCHA